MKAKQIGGILCLVLAAAFFVSGASSLAKPDGPQVGDASGLGVSRMIGAFLPGVFALIIGLWLFQKPKPGKKD
ncbi:hypothetical protein KIH39_19270 [Telmatocola sphagniphila]|uniref:Uncharacterized protein n=1 Tax=Telmatocola sphagniphila TaxID=1123043 RepID=A0A8E6B2L7_9BACT|nr:hypothetical protein [Telmatocola sphagniphila]QVL30975.1 hypothetical protein KIH39_19270 [Telmatocola sphagniphila]